MGNNKENKKGFWANLFSSKPKCSCGDNIIVEDDDQLQASCGCGSETYSSCCTATAGMIGASNFFELSVAVAISLFGLQSGAALATVVGVLVEVPVMLTLVKIANNTRKYFKNN